MPAGCTCQASAASRPIDRLPSHCSVLTRRLPKKTSPNERRCTSAMTSATVLALTRNAAPAAAAPTAEAAGSSGRGAGSARLQTSSAAVSARATWPTLNAVFAGGSRRASCQHSAPAAAPSVGAPTGASRIAATQTASASENSSSSPPRETESVKRSARTLATRMTNAAVSVPTGAAVASTAPYARTAAPTAGDNEQPARSRQPGSRGGGYCHELVPQNFAPQNLAPQNF